MEAVLHEDDLTGRRVAHYAIGDLIGTGGMGRVYRARDERLQRDVAIKVLDPLAAEPWVQRGLRSEARALSRLTHPHVAGIYDLVTESERDFLIMEFVAGLTLKDLLSRGPLPLADVVRLGGQLADGLAAAHEACVVHRDIKPGNLKMTSSGTLKIIDFGLARTAAVGDRDFSATTTAGSGCGGTLPYMAPEQLSGQPGDALSDIYSAGAVIYEMATATRAFPQRQLAQLVEAIVEKRPAKPSQIVTSVPLAFDAVVEKALRKSPSRRYQSAAELRAALEQLSTPRRREGTMSGGWFMRLLG